MNPPISDLIEFILSEEKTCQIHAMFGSQLLVESYKSFTIPKPRTATPNCRIQMLRFAHDVRSSLNHLREPQLLECIRDCKCERCLENPLPKALPELERHLEVATREKYFDLYHQAPWIAGHQMLVILSHATDHGVRLCSNGHYVATVLHMYNLLHQSGAMTEESSVLESLCDALLQTVFGGSRPERKFYFQYASFLGWRLQFDRSKRHKSNSDKDSYKKPSWRIRGLRRGSRPMTYPSFMAYTLANSISSATTGPTCGLDLTGKSGAQTNMQRGPRMSPKPTASPSRSTILRMRSAQNAKGLSLWPKSTGSRSISLARRS